MTCIIPYPSESMCGASVAGDCMRLLNDNVGGIDRFVFAVGSDRSKNAVLRWLDGTTRTFARIGIHHVKEKAYNGTSVFRLCLKSTIDVLPDEREVLFVPPWWHFIAGSKLELNPVPDDVVSVMLAGWFWSECRGTINYRPRPCKYDDFVAVQSVQWVDMWTFSIDAPQVVNASHFRKGGVMDDDSPGGVDKLNKSNYWGRDDVNMVLVPRRQKPFFKDVLGASPDYRP